MAPRMGRPGHSGSVQQQPNRVPGGHRGERVGVHAELAAEYGAQVLANVLTPDFTVPLAPPIEPVIALRGWAATRTGGFRL